MTKTPNVKLAGMTDKSASKSKSGQVIALLCRRDGVALEEMSRLAGWQHCSTRSFLTGLKKKGHIIKSDKVGGVRRYRIAPNGPA